MQNWKAEMTKPNIVNSTFNRLLMSMILMIITTTVGVLVDGTIISRMLGADAMTAYGIASPGFIICVALSGIFATGCQTNYTKALSRGRLEEANNIFSVTCVLGILAAAVVMAVVILSSGKISVVLGASMDKGPLNEMTSAYLSGLALGLPGIMLSAILQPMMQIDGDAGRIIRSVFVMLITNVSGDLINVTVLHGGLWGMALATSVSYYCSLVVLLLHFSRKENRIRFHLKGLDYNCTKDILSKGLPTAVSRTCNTLRVLLINRLLFAISAQSAITAFSVQSNINNFFVSLPSGIGMVVLMMSAIYAGEEDNESQKSLVSYAVLLCVIGIGCVSILLLAGAPLISSIYLEKAPEIIPIATSCVRCYAVSMPLYGINMVMLNYFQGSGKSMYANMVCILDNLLLLYGLAYTLGHRIGLIGVWISFPLAELCMLLILLSLSLFRKKASASMADSFLMLKEEKESYSLNAGFENLKDVMDASVNVQAFAIEHGVDHKTAMYMGLFVEEIGRNIIQYGFSEKAKNAAALLLKIQKDQIILRIRDNCKAFDPQKQAELHSEEDRSSHIGIRMVRTMSDDFIYTNTLNMNNLLITLRRKENELLCND